MGFHIRSYVICTTSKYTHPSATYINPKTRRPEAYTPCRLKDGTKMTCCCTQVCDQLASNPQGLEFWVLGLAQNEIPQVS